MGVIGGIVRGIGKGVGALARGVRTRRIIKGTTGTGLSVRRENRLIKKGKLDVKLNKLAGKGTLSKGVSANKLARIEKRQGRKAERLKTGGGFLRRAITKRRAKKDAGLLKRQIRKKNRLLRKQGDTGTDTGTTGADTLISSGGPADALLTGFGAEPEQEQTEQNSQPTIMDFIKENWLIVAGGGLLLWLLLKSKKK